MSDFRFRDRECHRAWDVGGKLFLDSGLVCLAVLIHFNRERVILLWPRFRRDYRTSIVKFDKIWYCKWKCRHL